MIEAVVAVALRAIIVSVVLGGLLALGVLAITRAIALTASARHLLWTTALLAIGVMPFAGIAVSMWKGAPAPAPAAVTTPRYGATVVRHPLSGVSGTRAYAAAVANGPGITATRSAGDRLAAAAFWAPPAPSRSLALGAAAVWAGGALIGLLGLAGSIVRVRGLKRRSSPLDGTLPDELPWLTDVGPGREIYLRLSFETETPVAIGFRRPVILIPTELATADGLSAIEPLIMHEHAHLRRYDDWTNLVQRAIERVFWFNPVVWAIGRRIALEREIASDDAVVERTGETHRYATSLWRLAREMRMPEHAVVAPGALLTRKQISVRIEQLLDKNRGRLHRSPAAAVAVSVAALIAVGFVASSAPAVELPPGVTVANVHRTASVPQPVVVAHSSQPHHALAPAKTAVVLTGRHLVPAGPTQRLIVNVERTPELRSQHAPQPKIHAPAARAATLTVIPPRAGSVTAPGAPASTQIVIERRRTVADAKVPAPPAAPAAAELPDIARIGPQISADVSRAVHDAIAANTPAIPQRSGKRAAHYDGVKISRELVAACNGCSMENADVRGADLHGLKINAIDFAGADMRNVNLAGAQLTGVSLIHANLAGADLRGAQLVGVDIEGARFDGALFDNIRLTGVSLQHTSLARTSLRGVLGNCTGCDLSNMDLRGQDLHGISLTGADLSGADLRDVNLSGAHFMGVDLSGAQLTGADLTNAHFDGCDLSGASLRSAKTSGMTVHGSGSDG